MKPVWLVVLVPMAMLAQGPVQPQASMKQLMLDLIYPASNDILFFVNRGAPKAESDWAAVRRAALTLSESENLLTMRGRARDEADWAKDAKILSDVGSAAYRAAQARDFPALAALTESLDASCTTCHKQYRPNVFPRGGGATGGSK
jgi:cytochrome c556